MARVHSGRHEAADAHVLSLAVPERRTRMISFNRSSLRVTLRGPAAGAIPPPRRRKHNFIAIRFFDEMGLFNLSF